MPTIPGPFPTPDDEGGASVPPPPSDVQHRPYPDRFTPPQSGYPLPGYPPVMAAPSNGVATAGGVCGIVAAAISWIPIVNLFSFVLSIIAVALGAVGWKRANAMQREVGRPIGRGMAITGVVLGAIGLAIALIFIVALGSALNDISNPTSTSAL